MAIQIPNPGTGNGATGDNEFVLWSKVKDNFTGQTNAASRIVGTARGNVTEVGAFGVGNRDAEGFTTGTRLTPLEGDVSAAKDFIKNTPTGFFKASSPGEGFVLGSSSTSTSALAGSFIFMASGYNRAVPRYTYIVGSKGYDPLTDVYTFYTSQNTTVVNGNLKPSSPVVKIHTDSLELNNDAKLMGVTLDKRGVGDYLVQNTSGLRKDDGWYIELPQDVNGNPYFAVTYNQLENNDIEVKTYKRIFDMNTFMFGPDLDSPVDIKEGRSIAIRLNDLPADVLDDIQTEV